MCVAYAQNAWTSTLPKASGKRPNGLRNRNVPAYNTCTERVRNVYVSAVAHMKLVPNARYIYNACLDQTALYSKHKRRTRDELHAFST